MVKSKPENKGLHFRPKREYALKHIKNRKKLFKIEKKKTTKQNKKRRGSKKYILKRIQYCWKSYFVQKIIKIIPSNYQVLISKEFYDDYTKGFYLQIFNRLNTIKDLIADVIRIKKMKKDYKRKEFCMKNMGEFIKEIEINEKIKEKNFKLLDRLKKKILKQTIKMNMIKYFRSKDYFKRTEKYVRQKYDENDLFKFKNPIRFFYANITKEFKFQKYKMRKVNIIDIEKNIDKDKNKDKKKILFSIDIN